MHFTVAFENVYDVSVAGLLSRVTCSRCQYLQERELHAAADSLEALTMTDTEPQPLLEEQPHLLKENLQQEQPHHQDEEQQQSLQLPLQCNTSLITQQQHFQLSNSFLTTTSQQAAEPIICNKLQQQEQSRSPVILEVESQSQVNQIILDGSQSQSQQPGSSWSLPQVVVSSHSQGLSSNSKEFPVPCVTVPVASSQPSGSKMDSPDSLLNRSIARLSNFQPNGNPSNNFNAPFPLDRKGSAGTEKENSLFPGFQVLTMNTNFITSFTNDYRLPSHVDEMTASGQYPCSVLNHSMDSCLHKNSMKRNPFRRKRVRSHPYDNSYNTNSNYPTLLHMYNSSSASRNGNNKNSNNDATSSQYRLRTTSLSSSGVEGGRIRRRFLQRVRTYGGNPTSPVALMRSRSMEDLSINSSISFQQQQQRQDAPHHRTKEVENVSMAIQQLCVQDTR